MGETRVDDVAKAKPTIVVPPRGSMESLFANGMGGIGFSPGPMTLVSSFFSDQGPFSFSQLLAGAMASPVVAAKPGFLLSGDAGKGEESVDNSNSSEDGKGSESSGIGYKHNRPMTLVVAPPQMQQQAESFSPLFMIPSGLSPSGMLNSPGFLSPLQSPFGMSHQQALAHVTVQATLSQSYMQMHTEFQHSYSASPPTEAFASHSSPAPSETLTEQMNHPTPTEPKCSKIESSEVSQSDKKSANVPCNKPANDGYNWRKYGQKQVKASECPRSYYKCTYQNCSVKKKVERSFDGSVSEIVYKGEHNHSPPQSNKRKKDGSALDRTNSVVENEQEVLTSANQNDEREGPVIVIDNENDDEPLAKRRSLDNGQSVPLSSHQTITESKIVVQTRSEVDLLDDGYKWRKYGQKVVKGNPHPRCNNFLLLYKRSLVSYTVFAVAAVWDSLLLLL